MKRVEYDFTETTSLERGRAMPNPIERKRLKKRMLDRWENEGGRIGPDSAGADDKKPPSEDERQDQPSASRSNGAVGGSAPSTKKLKARK